MVLLQRVIPTATKSYSGLLICCLDSKFLSLSLLSEDGQSFLWMNQVSHNICGVRKRCIFDFQSSSPFFLAVLVIFRFTFVLIYTVSGLNRQLNIESFIPSTSAIFCKASPLKLSSISSQPTRLNDDLAFFKSILYRLSIYIQWHKTTGQ